MSGSFTAEGEPRKTEEIKKHIPPTMTTRAGTLLGAIMHALGIEDHNVAGDDPDTEGLEAARLGILIDSATGKDLNIIGQNFGIRRPLKIPMPDALYRKYIKTLAFKRKLTRNLIVEFATHLLGDKATVHWDIFEIRPNSFVLDLGDYITPTGPATATYLRSTATASVVAHPGDYLLPDVSEPTIDSHLAGSTIENLSVWLGSQSFPIFNELLILVRAAGVQVEVRKRDQ